MEAAVTEDCGNWLKDEVQRVNTLCYNCMRDRNDHVDFKCLFEHTTYEPLVWGLNDL